MMLTGRSEVRCTLLAMLLLLGGGAAEGQLAPLPAPTGGEIGVTRFALEDSARSSSTDGLPRLIGVHAWYPADASTRHHASYIDSATMRAMMPNVERHQRARLEAALRMPTHARVNAPVRSDGVALPVIVFSHGGDMLPAHYTSQIEELASRGYVVLALAHPGVAPAVVGAGRAVATPPVGDTRPTPAAVARVRENILGMVADLRFVARRVASRTLPLPAGIALLLDSTRIGVVGHSVGGIAAATACRQDPRFVACVNEDGLVEGIPYLPLPAEASPRPLLFLSKGFPVEKPATFVLPPGVTDWSDMRRRMRGRIDSALVAHGEPTFVGELASADHMTFSDYALLPRDRGGAPGGTDAVSAIRYALTAFFDAFLRREGSADRLLRAETPLSVRQPAH